MFDTINETQQAFQLRGSLFTLSVIQLFVNDLALFEKQLVETVKQAPKFFKLAPIVLDLQKLQDQDAVLDLQAICKLLRQQQMIPVGIRGGTKTQHDLAAQHGMAVLSISKMSEPQLATRQKKIIEDLSPEKSTPQESTNEQKTKPTNNIIISKPVRSGQQIYAKGGDLVVIGSVSPGSELLADGNIHVYGALRGRALAGINDNTQARIFCQSMEAELISIAGRYIVNETLLNQLTNKPQQAYLVDGKLKIDSL